MIEGSWSGSIPRTTGSGFRRIKNIRILRIRIRNTAFLNSILNSHAQNQWPDGQINDDELKDVMLKIHGIAIRSIYVTLGSPMLKSTFQARNSASKATSAKEFKSQILCHFSFCSQKSKTHTMKNWIVTKVSLKVLSSGMDLVEIRLIR